MKTISNIYSGILLVLVCFLVSVNPSISQSAGVDKKPPYNALEDAKGIEDWRNEQYEKLRKEGKATGENFKRIDDEALTRGRGVEPKRQKALNEIFEKAGVKMPAQTGTTPGAPESRGGLGDVDFESLSPKERDRVLKAAKDLGYKTKPQGDALTIEELNSTVHREEYKRKSGPVQQSEQVGRAAGKETASSYGGTDPTTGKPTITDKHINTMDNLKKGGHTLTTDPGKMTNSDWAEMGKMTSRNMENGGVKNTDLRNKAEMLKKGYSPEAAGIVPDNATPAQREKALREFRQQCKEANRQAYSNTEKIAKNKEKELKSKVNEQKAKLDEAIGKGNQNEIDSAKKNLQDARKELSSHNTKQHAAKEGVNINKGESVIKEMEKTPGTSKPGDVKEPVKGKPKISEPVGKVKVKDVNLIKENMKIEKGGGLFIFGYESYEAYKRRMEEDPKRSKLDAAGGAALEASGIPALHTIIIKTEKEYKGEPEKAAIATAWNVAKAVVVGFVEYTIDKAKKIPEAHNDFVEKRIAEMAADRIEKASKAERENQKKYIYDSLIKEGASPVGASKAVESFERGDSTPLHTLRENLKVKREEKEKAEKEKLEKENAEEKRKAEKERKERDEKERLKAEAERKLKESKEEKTTAKKDWERMTPEERRDALKSNDPRAWEKVKESLEGNSKSGKEVIDAIDSKPTPSGNVDKISDLRSSENKTDQMDKDKEGQSMELAGKTNVADSYHKNRSSKSKEESQQVQTTAGLTQAEREAASQEKDQREKSKIEAQGKLTDRTISSSQKEHAASEQNAQAERQTGIGTIIAGGLFGGLSSGVAVGLDSFFGGLGKGAGEQASVKTGIQPKPTPPPSPTSSESESQPSSSAGSESQSSSTEGKKQGTPSTSNQTSTSSGAQSSGESKSASSSGSQKPQKDTSGQQKGKPCKGQKHPGPDWVCIKEVVCYSDKNQTAKDCVEWANTVTGVKTTSPTAGSGQSKPTSTSSSKPSSSQGSKPDCSEYRRRAEDLTSSYEKGSISTAAYQGDMRELRTKYKICLK